jgi:ADP-heptose:LPS heptosyltransferase/lauroyl/myristoyl acyltransferase
MIIRPLLSVMGYLIAHLPLRCIAFLCQILGRFFFLFFPKRRRIILCNLAHAFPDKTQEECEIVAQKSCSRMIELGLLAATLPYFSEKRMRQSFQLDASIGEFFSEKEKNGGPRIVLLPHFSQMEAMTIIPLLSEGAAKNEIGVIYRPFKSKALERWIRKTRERFGLKLLSRGNGFLGAKEILKRNGIVVILFDQNANDWGILSTFFGRIASTTPLPDLLHGHFRCPIYMLMPQRLGIFQAKCFAERLDCKGQKREKSGHCDSSTGDAYGVAKAMNSWLERKLSSDGDIRCDWLWAHNRWRTHDQKHNWLNLSQKRCAIDFSKIEKKIKIFIRMPNWLGDILMAIPLIRAVRRARPDAQITLIARPRFIQFLENLCLADGVLPIEEKHHSKKYYPRAYYQQLFAYRRLKPDFCICLMNQALSGNIEVLLLNARHSFAQQFLGKKAPWFSEKITMNRDGPSVHQVENLHFFAEQMGYRDHWDLRTIDLKIEKLNAIALICGSENNPNTRWPVHHWIRLIEILLRRTTANIMLFGTANDLTISRKITHAFPHENRLIDRTGKTNLLEFAHEIASCKFAIGNDTGGVHLSNFLGIPTVVLFGPTNPHKTRPIFGAPVHIILSPDRKNFAALTPNFVAEMLSNLDLFSFS